MMWVKNRLKIEITESKDFSRHLLDPESCLYCEGYFRERIRFESRRVERSKRALPLMRIDIGALTGNGNKSQFIEMISNVVSSCTRETDLKGWLKHPDIIGVLFTEAGEINQCDMKEKVYGNLYDCLEMNQVHKIKISFCSALKGNDHKLKRDLSQDHSFTEIFHHEAGNRQSFRRIYTAMKRGEDVLGSLLGLLVFSPIFFICSVMIKVSSKGPVFFKQERVGLNGKRFIMYKFRSMKLGNNTEIHQVYTKNLITGRINKTGHNGADQQGMYKIKNDDRVCPFGHFLRRTSLDELPQFMNVLMGDMSLVGPRPPIPYELDNYDLWHQRRLLEVKPGITGLWQVKGRSSCTFDEMVRLDLRYIRERSLWLDLKIILQTPWVVLTGKGAY